MSARLPATLPWALLLAVACAGQRAGAETNPWYVGVAQAFAYDSNLYRIEESVPLDPTLSRSDTVSITSLIAGLDQPIGRQRLYGNVALRNNRYQNNDYLNDNSYSLTAAFDWSTIERFAGTVSIAGSQAQKRFNVDTAPGVVDTRKNTETVEQFGATVRAGLVTRLTLDAGFGYRRIENSTPGSAASQYEQRRFSLGTRYQPGIATFGIALSRAETDYTAPDETVRRDALDLTMTWPASGSSSVYARISPTRISYDTFAERDLAGPTGALRWDWEPAGRVKMSTRLVHDIGQDSGFETFGGPVVIGTSEFSRVTTDLRLNLDYELTGKTTLSAAFGAVHRQLARRVSGGGTSTVVAEGTDDARILTLGGAWAPMRSVQVGCNIGRDRRTAEGGLTQAYDANTAYCFGQFTLQ